MGLFGGWRSLLRVEPGPHPLADRAGALFPKLQLCGSHQTLRVRRVLGDVQLGDEVEHLLGDGRCRQRLVEVAAQVRVAGRASSRRDFVDDVVAAVAVDEQHARRPFEQRLRASSPSGPRRRRTRRRARPRRRARRRSRRSRSWSCRSCRGRCVAASRRQRRRGARAPRRAAASTPARGSPTRGAAARSSSSARRGCPGAGRPSPVGRSACGRRTC